MNFDLSAIRPLTRDRRALTRIILAAATLLFTLIALYLAFAGNARHERLQDVNQRSAWNRVTASNATVSLENFIVTWAAKRSSNAEQASISWIVRDGRDLRQSLLALDATRVAVQRINVTKLNTDFTVSAEVAP
jgi:hypothetical protein